MAARMTTVEPTRSAPSAGETADGERRGGPPPWFTLLAAGSLLVAVLLLGLQLLGIGVGFRVGEPTVPPTGNATQVTRALVVKALEAASFQVQDPLAGYRPGESPELVGVPRELVQAVMPEDPSAGYVVIYELASANDADRVGREFLRYLGGGTGAVQYPRDSRFVVRRVGPTLVFYAYSVEASPDARVAELAAALETVGTPVSP
jgi:hypothetical protein